MMHSLFSSSKATNEEEHIQSQTFPEHSSNLSSTDRYLLGIIAVVGSCFAYRKFGKRIQNSEWVTPLHVSKRRWIKGVVTSVGDADNFRLYHTPAIGYNWPLRFKRIPSLPKDLKDETIHIRLAGIDAPEGTYFGKPGQPYHTEAFEWLRQQILGKKLYCQVLRKDQYKRIVAQVQHPPRILPGFLFNGKNVAVEMLKAGWAVTYTQAGAEYGSLGQDGYLQLENQAKRARRGMWKSGKKQETPADYKRRHAGGGLETSQTTKPALASGRMRSRSRKGWWHSWFKRRL